MSKITQARAAHADEITMAEGIRVGLMATVLWSFVVTIVAWYGAGCNVY